MNTYKFGKGLLTTVQESNSIVVSKLASPLKVGESALNKETTDAIELKFATVESIDSMIKNLQSVRKNMLKRKLKKLLGVL